MPKKKVWIWGGKVVSKTSFYRLQAAAKAAGKLTAKARNPKSPSILKRGLSVEEVAPPQNLYSPEEIAQEAIDQAELKPKLAPPDPVDDALIRDHMVGIRARGFLQPGNVNLDGPVFMSPRVAVAVMRLLDRMGY